MFVPLTEDALGHPRAQTAGAAVLLGLAVGALAVNLLHMSLARGIARRRRAFIGIALGATTRDLFLATLVDQGLIWVCGACLAPLVSQALLKAMLPNTPLAGLLTPEVLLGRAMAWELPLVVGLMPLMAAVQSSSERIGVGIDATGRATAGRQQHRCLAAVALSQAMFAASLLVVTSGVARAAMNIESTTTGLAEDGLSTFRVIMPTNVYPTPAERLHFCGRVLTELHRIPGVIAAEAAVIPILAVPASPDRTLDQELDGPAQRWITPGFLSTVGIRIVAGRLFNPLDSPTGVAVVNEEYVRRFGGGGQVVGKGINVDRRRQIVGVVSNVRDIDIWVRPRPLVYLPYQGLSGALTFVMRSAKGIALTYAQVRTAVSRADATVAIREYESLRDRVARARAPWQARSLLAAWAAAIGLCLLLSGVHSVTQFVMLEQRRNLAIRMALGGQTSQLLAVFGGRLLVPVCCGAAVGVVLGWVGLVLLRWQLYGVGAGLAVVSFVPALLVPAIALVLSSRAARTFARADLAVLLRAE
jgi:putative ABC transport system permease protein